MSEDFTYNGNYHSKIVEVNGEDYLVQGRIDDPLTMFRRADQVMECERDQVQIWKGAKEVLKEDE